MREINWLWIIVQGVLVGIFLTAGLGLELTDWEWWVGCVTLNGLGGLLHWYITE